MADEISPLFSLPEDCIANIISFTSPKDACRATAVSLGFKSAAESDAVWDRFLPPDYKEVVSGSNSPVTCSTKKEFYFSLCESPLLVDGGKMSFRLSRSTGKKCYMLCAREVEIAWIHTPMHWTWTSLPESRFAEVAELLSVCWLEIRGTLRSQMLSPKTNYSAYLVFKLSENHYGLHCSSKASVKVVKESTTKTEGDINTVYIVPPTNRRVKFRCRRPRLLPLRNAEGRVPFSRTDGWLEIELGEFFIDEGDEFDVQIQLCETEHLNWKKGLIVEGIEVRPKE
ncbi:hypothetical protein DH2020_027353 [Rehmannia glutinosa]|uniref:F-box domain-containing protein n=1 Tax=Rehmannia glutinosa TaxID=99300 RepID=A0ABR0VUG6_REHGL